MKTLSLYYYIPKKIPHKPKKINYFFYILYFYEISSIKQQTKFALNENQKSSCSQQR